MTVKVLTAQAEKTYEEAKKMLHKADEEIRIDIYGKEYTLKEFIHELRQRYEIGDWKRATYMSITYNVWYLKAKDDRRTRYSTAVFLMDQTIDLYRNVTKVKEEVDKIQEKELKEKKEEASFDVKAFENELQQHITGWRNNPDNKTKEIINQKPNWIRNFARKDLPFRERKIEIIERVVKEYQQK